MADDFKMIIIPNYLNPEAPNENLVLVFTVEEMEKARRRGESVVRNRERKGEKSKLQAALRILKGILNHSVQARQNTNTSGNHTRTTPYS